ncbi:hypothetical protein [Salinicola peritrichatus]|uniref:hypothetical protein n=1 Tax=Salinicola peritrichatus TaxID=1267424 RepID=UPI0013A5FCDE|nr:hypothetical protein [Salinicola peritrichatus]
MIDIKIRPVTRFIVTRHTDNGTTGSNEECGEFISHDQAEHVAFGLEALAKADGKQVQVVSSDDRMADLTDIDLLAELIRRRGVGHAPKRREYHTPHYDVCVGVGRDHTADITLDGDSLLELNRRRGCVDPSRIIVDDDSVNEALSSERWSLDSDGQ